jgi:uncharacterized protein with HEPN domain
MSKDFQRIEFILEMISNMEIIVKRKNGIVNALSDRVESRPAILMALLQVGETLNKLHSNTITNLEISKSDIKGAYNVRNFIAHDYEGVDLGLIEHIIRKLLPDLKSKLERGLERAL